MSQCATLYRISQLNFGHLTENPDNFQVVPNAKSYLTLDQTFEALRFILSKEQDDANSY